MHADSACERSGEGEVSDAEPMEGILVRGACPKHKLTAGITLLSPTRGASR